MKIFELNNHAISLMCKGDYESALAALQAALSMAHELGSDDEECNDMSPLVSAPAAMVLEKEEMPPSPEGSLPEASMGRTGVVGGVEVIASSFIEAGHTEDNDESTAAPFYMYRRALLLSGDHPYGTPAVLLYNAGLLYHIQGLSKQIRPNNSMKTTYYINKAIRFYSCAVDILDCGTDYFDVGHLMLALLNNLGHAKMHLADYEASYQYFKRLKLVLTAILVDASSGTHQTGSRVTMTDEECHIFLQNTLMLFCVHSDGKTFFFTNAPAA